MSESDKKALDAKKDQKKDEPSKDDKGGAALTESDIAMFKRYGKGPYTDSIRKVEEDIKEFNQKISVLCGIKESDTGLALPAQWNLA
jgi:26S proteasome regulatory subunit T1